MSAGSSDVGALALSCCCREFRRCCRWAKSVRFVAREEAASASVSLRPSHSANVLGLIPHYLGVDWGVSGTKSGMTDGTDRQSAAGAARDFFPHAVSANHRLALPFPPPAALIPLHLQPRRENRAFAAPKRVIMECRHLACIFAASAPLPFPSTLPLHCYQEGSCSRAPQLS